MPENKNLKKSCQNCWKKDFKKQQKAKRLPSNLARVAKFPKHMHIKILTLKQMLHKYKQVIHLKTYLMKPAKWYTLCIEK